MSDLWSARAACRGADESLFFPPMRGAANTAPALVICRGCPVRDECLEHALSTPEQFGVWGGTTEAERHEMKLGRKRKPPPQCGTAAAYARHRRRGEQPCGRCLEGAPRERARRHQESQRTA